MTLRDSEPTKRHETRGHSSWFDVVLSRIRLHSLRLPSVGACKHHGVLGRPGGRRQAAPSNIGHEGGQETLRIDRDSHPRSLSSKLYIVNSRKEWLSALVSSCQARPHATRTRHMLRASQRPNEDGACGQAARRKSRRKLTPGRKSSNAPSLARVSPRRVAQNFEQT